MICNSCGAKNKSDAKICEVCGDSSLAVKETVKEKEGLKCKSCGGENNNNNKFCSECGESLGYKNVKSSRINNLKNSKIDKKLKQKLSQAPNIKPKRKSGPLVFNIKTIYIALCVVLGAIIFISTLEIITPTKGSMKTGDKEIKSSNPALEANVTKIADKFICNCGGCSKESLAICKCDAAIKARKQVREMLEQSQREDEIIKVVNEKFGGLKNESKI